MVSVEATHRTEYRSAFFAATTANWVSATTLHEFPVRCILLLGKVCVPCVCVYLGGGGGGRGGGQSASLSTIPTVSK